MVLYFQKSGFGSPGMRPHPYVAPDIHRRRHSAPLSYNSTDSRQKRSTTDSSTDETRFAKRLRNDSSRMTENDNSSDFNRSYDYFTPHDSLNVRKSIDSHNDNRHVVSSDSTTPVSYRNVAANDLRGKISARSKRNEGYSSSDRNSNGISSSIHRRKPEIKRKLSIDDYSSSSSDGSDDQGISSNDAAIAHRRPGKETVRRHRRHSNDRSSDSRMHSNEDSMGHRRNVETRHRKSSSHRSNSMEYETEARRSRKLFTRRKSSQSSSCSSSTSSSRTRRKHRKKKSKKHSSLQKSTPEKTRVRSVVVTKSKKAKKHRDSSSSYSDSDFSYKRHKAKKKKSKKSKKLKKEEKYRSCKPKKSKKRDETSDSSDSEVEKKENGSSPERKRSHSKLTAEEKKQKHSKKSNQHKECSITITSSGDSRKIVRRSDTEPLFASFNARIVSNCDDSFVVRVPNAEANSVSSRKNEHGSVNDQSDSDDKDTVLNSAIAQKPHNVGKPALSGNDHIPVKSSLIDNVELLLTSEKCIPNKMPEIKCEKTDDEEILVKKLRVLQKQHEMKACVLDLEMSQKSKAMPKHEVALDLELSQKSKVVPKRFKLRRDRIKSADVPPVNTSPIDTKTFLKETVCEVESLPNTQSSVDIAVDIPNTDSCDEHALDHVAKNVGTLPEEKLVDEEKGHAEEIIERIDINILPEDEDLFSDGEESTHSNISSRSSEEESDNDSDNRMRHNWRFGSESQKDVVQPRMSPKNEKTKNATDEQITEDHPNMRKLMERLRGEEEERLRKERRSDHLSKSTNRETRRHRITQSTDGELTKSKSLQTPSTPEKNSYGRNLSRHSRDALKRNDDIKDNPRELNRFDKETYSEKIGQSHHSPRHSTKSQHQHLGENIDLNCQQDIQKETERNGVTLDVRSSDILPKTFISSPLGESQPPTSSNLRLKESLNAEKRVIDKKHGEVHTHYEKNKPPFHGSSGDSKNDEHHSRKSRCSPKYLSEDNIKVSYSERNRRHKISVKQDDSTYTPSVDFTSFKDDQKMIGLNHPRTIDVQCGHHDPPQTQDNNINTQMYENLSPTRSDFDDCTDKQHRTIHEEPRVIHQSDMTDKGFVEDSKYFSSLHADNRPFPHVADRDDRHLSSTTTSQLPIVADEVQLQLRQADVDHESRLTGSSVVQTPMYFSNKDEHHVFPKSHIDINNVRQLAAHHSDPKQKHTECRSNLVGNRREPLTKDEQRLMRYIVQSGDIDVGTTFSGAQHCDNAIDRCEDEQLQQMTCDHVSSGQKLLYPHKDPAYSRCSSGDIGIIGNRWQTRKTDDIPPPVALRTVERKRTESDIMVDRRVENVNREDKPGDKVTHREDPTCQKQHHNIDRYSITPQLSYCNEAKPNSRQITPEKRYGNSIRVHHREAKGAENARSPAPRNEKPPKVQKSTWCEREISPRPTVSKNFSHRIHESQQSKDMPLRKKLEQPRFHSDHNTQAAVERESYRREYGKDRMQKYSTNNAKNKSDRYSSKHDSERRHESDNRSRRSDNTQYESSKRRYNYY